MEFLGHYSESARCTSLASSFELWEEYVAEAESAFERYRGPKLAIAFEDLASSSEAAVAELARFAALDPTDDEIRAVATRIRPERAGAFVRNERSLELWRSVKDAPLMRALGYDRLPGAER